MWILTTSTAPTPDPTSAPAAAPTQRGVLPGGVVAEIAYLAVESLAPATSPARPGQIPGEVAVARQRGLRSPRAEVPVGEAHHSADHAGDHPATGRDPGSRGTPLRLVFINATTAPLPSSTQLGAGTSAPDLDNVIHDGDGFGGGVGGTEIWGVDAGEVGRSAAGLAPGGVLAVVTTSHRAGGVLHDPRPGLVRAARAAGLGYLQHIVTIARDPATSGWRLVADVSLFRRPDTTPAAPVAPAGVKTDTATTEGDRA